MKPFLLSYRRSFFIFLLCVGYSAQSFAGITRTWTGSVSTYWSNPSNWSPVGIPQVGDNLIMGSAPHTNYSINIDVAPPTLKRMTFNVAGNSWYISAYGANMSLVFTSIDTALYVGTGSFVVCNNTATPTLRFAFSGSVNKAIINGTLGLQPGSSYYATSSNTIVRGTLSTNQGAIVSTATNLQFAGEGMFTNTISGYPIPTATWNDSSVCKLSSPTLIGLGQSFVNFAIDDDLGIPFQFKGRLTNIRGNLNISSGFVRNTYSFGSDSAFTMNIGGTLSITENTTTNNVNRVTFTDGSASPVINVGSILKPQGKGYVVDLGTGTGAAIVYMTGNLTHQGIAMVRSGSGTTNGSIYFTSAEKQIAVDTSDRIDYYVPGNGNIATLSANMVINKTLAPNSGSFTVGSHSYLFCGAYVIKAAQPGYNNYTSFTLSPFAVLSTASPDGITASGTASGVIQTNTRNYSVQGNYWYVGGSQVTGLPTMTVNELVANGTGTLTLSNKMTINGDLTISLKTVQTSDAAMLIMGSASTEACYPGYVVGPIEKVGNTAFYFPVGSTASGQALLEISAPSSITDTFKVQYFQSSAAALGTVQAINLVSVSPCSYWFIAHYGSAPQSVNITAIWNSQMASCYSITNPSAMALARLGYYIGGQNHWNAYGKNSNTSSAVT